MYLLANVCVSFNKNIKQYLKTFKTKRYDVFVFIFLILQSLQAAVPVPI